MKRGATVTEATPDLPIETKKVRQCRGLSNATSFPSFESLPRSAADDRYFFRLEDSFLRPLRHWCLLAEINHVGVSGVASNFRPRVTLKSVSTNQLPAIIEFCNSSDPTTFNWADLRPGNTVAVLYATRTILADAVEGVFVRDLDKVFVFNSSLSLLSFYAENLTLKKDVTNSVNLTRQAIILQWLCQIMNE